MTISAPKERGCCKKGVAKVLSTPRSILNFLAIRLSPLISIIFIIGFVGVSTQISLVLLLIKFSTLDKFCISVK